MKTQKMTEGNSLKLIIWFALPLMLGNIFQQLYTVIDSAIVGQILGVSMLAAIGATDWLTWLAFSVLTSFPQGFSILIAQAYGADDKQRVNQSLIALIQNSILVLIVFVTVGSIVIYPVLQLLNTPSDIIEYSYRYVRIIYLGLPITMFYNACSSILRAFGNSKTPLYAMVISSVINILLDFVFILYFHMGVEGAALATVIAQMFAGFFCFMTIRKNAIIERHLSLLNWHKSLNVEMMKIGTPMAFQNVLISVGGMFVSSAINAYGTLFIAGFTAVNKMYGLLEVAAVSYGYATVTYVGQNYGAKKYNRIKEGVRNTVILGIVTAIIVAVIIQLFDKQILLLFITGEASDVAVALAVGENYLLGICLTLFVLYLIHIYRKALQGLSNTFIPMVSGFVELACRIIGVYVFPIFLQETGLYLVEPFTVIGATCLLVYWYYKTERKLFMQDQS